MSYGVYFAYIHRKIAIEYNICVLFEMDFPPGISQYVPVYFNHTEYISSARWCCWHP
jgi:hypothetical protein